MDKNVCDYHNKHPFQKINVTRVRLLTHKKKIVKTVKLSWRYKLRKKSITWASSRCESEIIIIKKMERKNSVVINLNYFRILSITAKRKVAALLQFVGALESNLLFSFIIYKL